MASRHQLRTTIYIRLHWVAITPLVVIVGRLWQAIGGSIQLLVETVWDTIAGLITLIHNVLPHLAMLYMSAA